MSKINLKGSKKYLTANPRQYLEVCEGLVFVYVTRVMDQKLERSVLLSEVGPGMKIPSLSLANSEGTESYHFMVRAGSKAVIEIKDLTDSDDIEAIREEFLKNISESKTVEMISSDEERFSVKIFNWYNYKLEQDKEAIRSMREEKDRITDEKEILMAQTFRKSRKLRYENSAESPLYNVMSVFCEYMNIEICSYQVLKDAFGNDFTVDDIARISHFVTRKITLPDKWYKHSGSAFMAFKEENGYPVLCIPKGSRRYTIYDFETQSEYKADDLSPKEITKEGYVIYPHLPQSSLEIKDVIMFGLKRFNPADVTNYMVLYLLITLVGLLLPFLTAKMYDQLIPLGMWDSIVQVGGVILACMIGNMFFTIVRNLASFRSIKNMEYVIVASTYDRIFKLPQKFIEKFGTMELINRVNSISGIFSSVVIGGVSAIVGFILGLFYLWKMFSESKPLAIRFLILSLLSGLVIYAFGMLRIGKERQKLETSSKANGMLYRFMSGILKIKVSGIENRSLYEFEKVNVESLGYDIRSIRISNVGNLVNGVMGMIITGVMYFTIIKKNETLSLGNYASFMTAYGMFSSVVTSLVSFFLTVATLIPVMDRIKPIFNEPCEITDRATIIGKMDGRVDISHLNFSYEGEERQVLNDINMKIAPGEYIGIVGPSGSGKSTLLKCLMGFESPKSGKIYLDNKDVDTLDKCEMRRQIGAVLQDGKLLSGNIFTNVTLAAPNMKPVEVEKLLVEVGMGEDLKKMPMGIFTRISEGGGSVSGGQQQRILIARALANNPSMVFFDEATSALDNITQAKVCETLESRNMTRIMIAHRLSTVINCDRIYVMDNGHIVESGNYEELMNKKGLFYELAVRQKVEAV